MIQLPQVEPDWLKFGAVGAGLVIAYRALTLVDRLLPKKLGNGPKAGDLPPAHWEAKFDRLADIGEHQTKILEGIAQTNVNIEKTLAVMLDRTHKCGSNSERSGT